MRYRSDTKISILGMFFWLLWKRGNVTTEKESFMNIRFYSEKCFVHSNASGMWFVKRIENTMAGKKVITNKKFFAWIMSSS